MKRKSLLLILLFALALPAQLLAQDKFVVPTQKIEDSETPIEAGELVVLRLSQIANPPQYLADWKVTWKVFDGAKEKKVRVDNNECWFGAGLKTRELTAVAAVSYLYLIREGGVVKEVGVRGALLWAKIKVVGPDGPSPPDPPSPGPNPPNPPTPEPEPNFPEGQYGLARVAYRIAMVRVTQDRQKGAMAVAGACKSIASAIAAGAVKDLESGLRASADANDNALKSAGIQANTWSSFGDDLQRVLYGLYKEKKLTTADQLKTALEEISLGLERVR